MTGQEIKNLLFLLGEEPLEALTARAYAQKCELLGKRVALRGLIEFSNFCRKNCFYCGIRRDNANVKRYRMTEDEIVAAASWSADRGYGSVVLQSGEVPSEENARFVARVVSRIHEKYGDALGITLSLGEQSEETFRLWRNAGAHRYLLRIESSNPELYARIHPCDHSWQARRDCLRMLKRLGYIVGTGVMVGLPGQTLEDLANDIVFFADEDVDMIGMGPFIEDPGTPMFNPALDDATRTAARRTKFDLTLRMIAAVRLTLKDVNIAAATALQAIDPDGREKGVLAGANVIMPNVTPRAYCAAYRLYPNKPCVHEHAEACRGCLESRLKAIGEEIAWGGRGDPLHFGKGKA